ncbi:hypothetical protein D3C85_1045840 [compost metagenome]
MQVRRTPRVPVAGIEQATDRAVAGDRITHRDDGADGKAALLIGAIAATQVTRRLLGVLTGIHAVCRRLPDVQGHTSQRPALTVEHTAMHQRGRAGR